MQVKKIEGEKKWLLKGLNVVVNIWRRSNETVDVHELKGQKRKCMLDKLIFCASPTQSDARNLEEEQDPADEKEDRTKVREAVRGRRERHPDRGSKQRSRKILGRAYIQHV